MLAEHLRTNQHVALSPSLLREKAFWSLGNKNVEFGWFPFWTCCLCMFLHWTAKPQIRSSNGFLIESNGLVGIETISEQSSSNIAVVIASGRALGLASFDPRCSKLATFNGTSWQQERAVGFRWGRRSPIDLCYAYASPSKQVTVSKQLVLMEKTLYPPKATKVSMWGVNVNIERFYIKDLSCIRISYIYQVPFNIHISFASTLQPRDSTWATSSKMGQAAELVHLRCQPGHLCHQLLHHALCLHRLNPVSH